MLKKLLFLIVFILPVIADARPVGGSESSTKSVLMGLNAAGLEGGSAVPGIIGFDYFQPTLAEMTYYRSKNLNHIRLPFKWERLQPTLGGPLDTTYLSYIQNVVGYATTLNMKVLLDIHNFGGYCYGAVCGQIGAVGGPTSAQFADVWLRLAQVFNGNSAIAGYDLMNEPHDMPNANAWPAAAQAAVTAIRVYDTVKPIYIEGDAYASAFAWLGNCDVCGGAPIGGWNPGGNNALKTIIDPDNNLIFSAHSYADFNSSGFYPTYPSPFAVGCTNGQNSYQCAQTMGDQLTVPTSVLDTNILTKRYTPFVSWCAQNNLHCHIGETGVPKDDPEWLVALDKGTALLQSDNVIFDYWNAGPIYGSYTLGVEPTNGIDTVQMPVLTKYSKAYQPTTYYLSGPQRGTSGVASTDFTVTYYGYLTNSVVITPNDTGAGGTFTPTSVTLSPGFNGTTTFTYTAPGTGVYAINVTNSAGLSNPVPLGYATVNDQFSLAGITSSQASNILAMRKIYAPYIGNAVLLRRGADNTMQSFGFTGLEVNSPLDTAAILTWNGTKENYTLGGTTVIVKYAPQFQSDGGVTYQPSGVALTKVVSSPAVGQYSVSAGGHYTFNAADIASTVRISYLFPTYVVTWYDQSPQAQNAGVVYVDSSATLFDQPKLLLGCQNGNPCISFDGTNRMDISSPITGNTQQTIFSVAAPSFHWGNGFALGWDWTVCGVGDPQCLYNFTDDYAGVGSQSVINDMWKVKTYSTQTVDIRMYSRDTAFDAIGTTLVTNTIGGIRAFLNGSPTGQFDTGPQNLYLGNSRSNATLGYVRFFSASWVGQISELVVLNTMLNNTNMLAFQADQDTYWGIPNTASYVYPTPTLPRNIGSANPPPWAGMNQSGAVGNFGKNFNFATSAAGQTYYAGRGFNIVRLPFDWAQLQQNLCTGDTTLNATWLAILDADVNTITASGMDVMLDMHNFGGYNYSFINTCASPPDNGNFTSATTSTYYVNFWTQLGAHYASNPKVIFDLMNEPAGTAAMTQAAVYQTTINGIRGAGFVGYISTEFGPSFAGCFDVVANAGPAHLTLTDPQNKLMLQCHFYMQACGNDTCGDYASQGASLANLGPATTYAAANSIKLFWGEFNMGYTPSMYAEAKVAFDLLAANPSVWIGWTEFGAGPAWPENYVGLIEPRSYPTPYVDRPQMRFLSTYATGGVWPTASGSWPNNVQFP